MEISKIEVDFPLTYFYCKKDGITYFFRAQIIYDNDIVTIANVEMPNRNNVILLEFINILYDYLFDTYVKNGTYNRIKVLNLS